MKLSSWTRLWIVASAIWWVAGSAWLIVQGPEEYLAHVNVLNGPHRWIPYKDWESWYVSLGRVIAAPLIVGGAFIFGRMILRRLRRRSPDTLSK